MNQDVITINSNNYLQLDQWISGTGCREVFLVCDSSLPYLQINDYFNSVEERLNIDLIRFKEFQSNPQYESVIQGVELFRHFGCDCIIAVGGGSAIDVAKCIKLFSSMKGDGLDGSFLTQETIRNSIPFLVMPTTAGTGSESTRFAVIYYRGVKQSVTDLSFVPDTILFDKSALFSLSLYQKKSTMLDAFCHAIESIWSINSTEESKLYAKSAIHDILENMDGYFKNDESSCYAMLLAANRAGRAIDITQTTAGHAMCYKITSLFGVAHGHAAALCDRVLFPWMVHHIDQCIDPRGESFLKTSLTEIAETMGCSSAEEGAKKFLAIFEALDLAVPKATDDELKILNRSVNSVRLKNHPINLDENTIDKLYRQILSGKPTKSN